MILTLAVFFLQNAAYDLVQMCMYVSVGENGP